MEFGNVKRYLKDYPEANRVLLLSEIASGTSLAVFIHRGALRVHQLPNICI